MSHKLQIVDEKLGINFNVRCENLSKLKKPEIEAKAPNGKTVKERTTYQGQVLGPGSTQRQWVDEDGNVYAKSELTFYFNGEEVQENQQTKVFGIKDYEPLKKYTDDYVMAAYYELSPDDNGHKKDIDKQVAVQANTFQMRKLWEYLNDNDLVGRAEFCISSRGFIVSDGYVRAVHFNGTKWGIEVGVFKEEKIFTHLQEGLPKEVKIAEKTKAKRLKMV